MLSKTTVFSNKKNASSLTWALTKLTQAKKSNDQGFSLLECLMAIVVIAVVITSFTPPIFLAVGTRIQNRRAEQALQLAQGEVDKVRRIVEQGDYRDEHLPPQASVDDLNVRTHSAPGGAETQNSDNPKKFASSASSGLEVDVNGDGTQDFIVQTYRSPGKRDSNGRLVAFGMGVRVYAYLVTKNFGELENPPTRAASLGLTTALGQQRRRPLAAMYTSVVRSDTNTSLCSYQDFLRGNLPTECRN